MYWFTSFLIREEDYMKFRASITKTVTFNAECNSKEELEDFLICSSDKDIENITSALETSYDEEILYPLGDDSPVDFCI